MDGLQVGVVLRGAHDAGKARAVEGGSPRQPHPGVCHRRGRPFVDIPGSMGECRAKGIGHR